MIRLPLRTALLTCFATGALFAGEASAAELKGFTSPSGNIGCYIDRDGVRCDIHEREWSPPPKPESCPFDWGQGLAVGKKGKGHFVCAGDTAFGGDGVLGYGETIKRGRFRCKSKLSGMRCANTRNQHGFKLSRLVAKRF